MATIISQLASAHSTNAADTAKSSRPTARLTGTIANAPQPAAASRNGGQVRYAACRTDSTRVACASGAICMNRRVYAAKIPCRLNDARAARSYTATELGPEKYPIID